MFAARAKAVKQAEAKRDTLEKCRKFSSKSSSSSTLSSALSLSPRSEFRASVVTFKNENENENEKDGESSGLETQESITSYSWIYEFRKKIRSILNLKIFESFMFLCIIVTAFMAGIDAYPSMRGLNFMKVKL